MLIRFFTKNADGPVITKKFCHRRGVCVHIGVEEVCVYIYTHTHREQCTIYCIYTLSIHTYDKFIYILCMCILYRYMYSMEGL